MTRRETIEQRRRRRVTIVAAFGSIGVLVALVGCADSSGDRGSTTAAPTTAAPTTAAPTTAAPTTAAPTTSAPTTAAPTTNTVVAANSDGLLSESEYQVFVNYMSDRGYTVLDRNSAQELGSMYCGLAKASQTSEEFGTAIKAALPPPSDTDEAVSALATLVTLMCEDEMTRLKGV